MALLLEMLIILPCGNGLIFNPNRSLGRICYVFLLYLLPFVFYKASNACFLLEIARYYSQKQQATSALLKIQNATSPNDRIGLKQLKCFISFILHLYLCHEHHERRQKV